MKKIFIGILVYLLSTNAFAFDAYTTSIRIKNCKIDDDSLKISAAIGVLDFDKSKGFIFDFKDKDLQYNSEKKMIFKNNEYQIDGKFAESRADGGNKFFYYVYVAGTPNFVKKAEISPSCE